jgi:predicted deacylase
MQLQQHQIDAPEEGPKLLITGGVHGDEFEPMAASRRLINLLQSGEVKLLRGGLTIVPVVNEAAFLDGARAAEDGLDLARICPGDEDGTTTERTGAALSKLIAEAEYYIDLHTGGTIMAVVPMAGYGLHSDPQILEQQRRMAQAFNLPFIWGTWPGHDGRSLSVARDAGVPAIYTEYGGAAVCVADAVEAYVDGCLNVMGMLGMIERTQPPSRVEHVVEDDRPDSGHMQVCYPSPMTGFFEPAVGLGDAIKKGDLFGTVADVLGNDVRTVPAEQSGIVLTLRTFTRVLEGDSLGVIVETAGGRS